MIYFTVTEGSQEVNYFHGMPFDEKWGLDKTEEELKETGFLAEKLPEQEAKEGFEAVLKYDGEKLFYEYEAFTPTLDEMQLLQQKVMEQENAIAELTMLISMQMAQ